MSEQSLPTCAGSRARSHARTLHFPRPDLPSYVTVTTLPLSPSLTSLGTPKPSLSCFIQGHTAALAHDHNYHDIGRNQTQRIGRPSLPALTLLLSSSIRLSMNSLGPYAFLKHIYSIFVYCIIVYIIYINILYISIINRDSSMVIYKF